ncbi:MAG: Calx-beta domain-containing protein, partial [Planctomycetota bacterium]
MIIDGDVRDDIIADVNVGYITAHNGTGRVFVSYDPVTTETTVSAKPVATFETAASSGIESGSSAIITVILYNPSGANTVTVDYNVTGGTADGNGTDYTLAPGTLIFDPCVGTRTIEIAIVDDGFNEEDETIEVTLSEPVNATLGAITQHTYTIVDPRPIVAFDAEASRGKEDVSPAEIPVSLSWVWPDTVTVDYNVTGGTAASGEDYSLPYGTLVFEPCSVTKYISIAITEDDYLEFPDETIEITLSNPSVGRLKTNTQHTYTILPPPAQVCPEGDLDGDCEVDYNDLGVFASQWLDPPGSCSGPNCSDLDGVNGIDTFDFALFAANWRVEAWPIVINEFMASNEETIQDPQEQYDDWIEIYNGSGVAVDIRGMWLADTGNLWMIPNDKPAETTIAAGGYVLIWADRDTGHTPGLHADFKLDRGGDRIELYAYDGVTLIDGIRFEDQETDISYGRYPDAEDSWRFFATPTPLAENEGAYIDEVADTKFSHDRGFYDSAFNLSITCATGGATIHYTLDGNEPNEFIFPGNGTYQYTGPININQTTFVRAAAFKSGYVPTNVDTHTYIFGANSVRKVLPTISLVGGELVDRTGAVSMELIYGDPNDGEGFQADCESEAHSIRSYRIKFKAEYGTSQLNYPFFESAPLYADSAVDRFDRLVLRDKSQKDVTWVAEPWTRLTQIAMSGPSHGGHSMYVHLYVNGIYKGLINPVERPDAWFASSYFGGDFDDYFATNHHELPDFGNHYLSGEPNRYETLLDMAYDKNLEDPNNYEDFKSLCDVIQFADYTILYWYSDFEDGVSNNYYAFMRNNPLDGSVPPEGLMYYMWDAEFAFTSCERPRVESSFFNRDVPMGHIWRALLENTDFRILFVDRIYKHCFNDGALTDENAEARWDLLYDYIASGGRTPYVAECFGGIPGSRDAFISMLRDWSEPNDWPGVELYPDFDAPTFNQQGGQVASGFNLEMFESSEHGDVYYTLDGSDPREAVTGNIVGMEYDDPIPLDRSRHVKARVFDDHDPNWSALNEVIF